MLNRYKEIGVCATSRVIAIIKIYEIIREQPVISKLRGLDPEVIYTDRDGVKTRITIIPYNDSFCGSRYDAIYYDENISNEFISTVLTPMAYNGNIIEFCPNPETRYFIREYVTNSDGTVIMTIFDAKEKTLKEFTIDVIKQYSRE